MELQVCIWVPNANTTGQRQRPRSDFEQIMWSYVDDSTNRNYEVVGKFRFYKSFPGTFHGHIITLLYHLSNLTL